MKNFTKILSSTLLLFAMMLWQTDLLAQATCAGAVALTPGTQQCGDSAGQPGDFPAGTTAPLNPCDQNYNDDEYWFSYTAVTDGETLDLTASGLTNTWAGLFVIDDCPSGAPTCVAQSTNNSSTADLSLSTPGLTMGTSYKIVISNFGTPNSTAFCLDAVVNPPAPPLDYCGADNFVDSGGTAGSYGINESINTLICPDVGTDKVSITFTSFAVEDNGAGTCWDELKIFDGMDNTATQIGPAAGFCYDGTGTSGTGYPGGALGVPITSTDASGCLYFEFTSDVSVTRAGWEATVDCGTPCVAPSNVALAGAGTTTGTVAGACHDGTTGYTYYEDPGNPGTFIFAVNWNASGNGRNDASGATITINNGAPTNADNGSTDATWTMGRYWNVSGATLMDPVDVKFYYDPAEKMAIEASMNGDGRPAEGFSWFKTVGVDFDPATHNTNGVGVEGSPIMLTDNGPGTDNGVTYAEFLGIASFSGGTGVTGVGGGANALPVELTVFKGNAKGTMNLLEWTTASEKNTAFHVIERSVDGLNGWKEIGRVAGAGFKTGMSNYTLEDERPLTMGYYRLKVIDLDDSKQFSNVVAIERKGEGFGIVNVFPVPTGDKVTIEFEANQNERVSIILTDVIGKVIYEENYNAVKGVNAKRMNLAQFADGIYFVTISNGVDKVTDRIIKN